MLEGPWTQPTRFYSIPAPLNDTTKYFCYAVKVHPELQSAAMVGAEDKEEALLHLGQGNGLPLPRSAAFIFSYVCNGRTIAYYYEPNGRTVYLPQLVRVVLLG